MATQILEFVQNELFIDMPYMSIALNALTLVNDEQIETMATDGRNLFYSASKMIHLFKNNQNTSIELIFTLYFTACFHTSGFVRIKNKITGI